MTNDDERAMPTPFTAHEAEAQSLPFVGWYDSSHDLLQGLIVTEWDALLDTVPEPPPHSARTLAFGIERRRRPRD